MKSDDDYKEKKKALQDIQADPWRLTFPCSVWQTFEGTAKGENTKP